MHTIASLITVLVFSCTLPASGTPVFPVENVHQSSSFSIEQRTSNTQNLEIQAPVEAPAIAERDEPSNTDVELYKRRGGGGSSAKKEDAVYTGTFGGLGILGSGGLGTGAGAGILLGGVAVALILAMAGWALFEWWKIVQEFHNSDLTNWPLYDQDKTSNNGQSVVASWSIRTFSDDGCGNPGLDAHGSHPYSQDHKNVPVMMTEYISSDLHYHDRKPCESFMISSDYTVNSVAVWMSAGVATDENPALALFYSHPLCHVTTDSSIKATGAPNGTIPTKPKDGYPDYMQAYNGSAVLYNGESGPVPGRWACLKGRFTSFSIIFSGETDVSDPGYPNGEITPADTVPAKGIAADVGKIKANHPFMVDDVQKTYQTGSRPGYPGI